MKTINEMELKFKALSINEGFSRSAIAAFCSQVNPSVDEITDIKTAVSEAVTNAVVHAYPLKDGDITIKVKLYASGVIIEVMDDGHGFNLEKVKDRAVSRGFLTQEDIDSVVANIKAELEKALNNNDELDLD